MRRSSYLWTSGVNLDTVVRFADHDFLLECKISAIWRRFPLIFAFYMLNVGHIPTSGLFDLRFPLNFAFYMLNVHHIFTSGCLTYWPRKYTTRVDPDVDNSHQVRSWYDHPLPSCSVFVCWDVTWLCDLDFWPFNLEQSNYISDHMTNVAVKFGDPTHIRSWVTSYNASHWLPLKMRIRPLRMRRIT